MCVYWHSDCMGRRLTTFVAKGFVCLQHDCLELLCVCSMTGQCWRTNSMAFLLSRPFGIPLWHIYSEKSPPHRPDFDVCLLSALLCVCACVCVLRMLATSCGGHLVRHCLDPTHSTRAMISFDTRSSFSMAEKLNCLEKRNNNNNNKKKSLIYLRSN